MTKTMRAQLIGNLSYIVDRLLVIRLFVIDIFFYQFFQVKSVSYN